MANLYDKASLVMIPSQYKDGNLYNIKPLKSSFEFERGSISTRINKNGLIENVSNDTPRLDYSGSEPSLLLEPQRTNLVTYSEDLSQWIGIYDTQIESGYIAPDGTSSAYKVTKAGSNSHIASNFGNTIVNGVHKSIWAKTTNGIGTVSLMNRSSDPNSLFTITNEWQRFDINHSDADFFYPVDFRANESTLTEVLIWGAQAEQGSYATSYIPTNGQAETRLREVLGEYELENSTIQTIFIECGKTRYAGGGGEFILEKTNPVSAVFRIYVEVDSSSTNDSFIRFRTEFPVNNYDFNLGNKDEFKKIALSIDGSSVRLFGNGSLLGTYQVTPVELEQLNWRVQNTTYSTKQVTMFPTALSDNECINLTTI